MTELWALTGSASELDVAVRDRLAHQMKQWVADGHDGVTLVTCHRAELYGIGVLPRIATPSNYLGGEATSHLFRVATGLESAVVGEDEVLHQVRAALNLSRLSHRLDSRLQRLFETAIATGRKARSRRTEMSGNLAERAVAWLRTKSDISGRMVVVAGAGRMGAALAHALQTAGAAITIASRHESRASKLARVYSGHGVDLNTGAQVAPQAAGIAVALGGPWRELNAIRTRDLPPIADISAPQAVPGPLRQSLNGSFLGIDDLYRCSSAVPGAYIRHAEALTAAKTDEFMAWLAREQTD